MQALRNWEPHLYQAKISRAEHFFHIVGLGLKAAPEYQAVPKGIATQVTTGFAAGDLDVAALMTSDPYNFGFDN